MRAPVQPKTYIWRTACFKRMVARVQIIVLVSGQVEFESYLSQAKAEIQDFVFELCTMYSICKLRTGSSSKVNDVVTCF